jgi:hypothetical protein
MHGSFETSWWSVYVIWKTGTCQQLLALPFGQWEAEQFHFEGCCNGQCIRTPGRPAELLWTVAGDVMLQLQQVLGALAEVAGAGYPSDVQQLATAAQLQQPAAAAIGAAIQQHGQQGIHTVKTALQAQVGEISYGQIKVVAAMMAVQHAWFTEQRQVVALDENSGQLSKSVDGPTSACTLAHQLEQQQQQQPPSSPTPSGWRPGKGASANAPGTPSRAQDLMTGETPHQQIQLLRQPSTLTDTSNLQEAGAAPGAVEKPCVDDDSEEQKQAAAAAQPKRSKPAFMLTNKSGKRRRATAIAPPGAATDKGRAPETDPGADADADADAVATCSNHHHQQQQQQQIVEPVLTAVSSPLLNTATPSPAVITQETVLQLLWDDTATAPQLLQKLGMTGRKDCEQQLQQVLQELVQSGDQVCTTPAGCGRIDVHDATVRFIAF